MKLELHHEKSKIISLHKGIKFLGFRNFYYFRLLKKSNVEQIKENLILWVKLDENDLDARLEGWKAHAYYSNSYNLVKKLNL